MRTTRTHIRCQLYLPPALAERLDALSRQPGATKSAILAEALSAWLDRGRTSEVDERFGERLNRINKSLARIDRSGDVMLESLALFIRYMLTVNAPLPEGDDLSRAVGNERFQAFIDRVGQQLATGKRTLAPEVQS